MGDASCAVRRRRHAGATSRSSTSSVKIHILTPVPGRPARYTRSLGCTRGLPVMHEMSVMWLRVAAVLYSLGLLHVLLSLIHRRRDRVFRVAIAAFYTGVVIHIVSIVEQTAATGRLPANDSFQSAPPSALLVA